MQLVFGATFVCTDCRLRFDRRAACPRCGSSEPLYLGDRDGRGTFAYRSRRQGGWRSRLAVWSPERVWVPLLIGALAMLPAVVARLTFGPTAFQETWLGDDLSVQHGAISEHAYGLLLVAEAGALLLVFVAITRWAAAKVEPLPPLRVHAMALASADATVLRGVAREGTMALASPLAGAPCLAFGLAGETRGGEVRDADGGDFDVDVDSGERVLVSLEHAVLVADVGARARVRVAGELEEFLEVRGLACEEASLGEVLLREGDRVELTGFFAPGAAVVTAGGRRARIFMGDEERPLGIRIGVASSRTDAAASVDASALHDDER